MEIISAKITSVFETGAVKAKANAVLGRFGVRGIKVCEGKSGLFVAMPHTSLQKENTSISFFQWIRKRRKSWPGPCSGPMRKNRRKTPRPRLWPGRNGVSPFFCVRTSPEPYGARAGQRLPRHSGWTHKARKRRRCL